MITAFASEYMQESPDGCIISETYLNLIAGLHVIISLDINELRKPDYDLASERHNSLNESDLHDQSVFGLGLMKDTLMKQEQTRADKRQKQLQNRSRHNSIDERSQSNESNNHGGNNSFNGGVCEQSFDIFADKDTYNYLAAKKPAQQMKERKPKSFNSPPKFGVGQIKF